MPQQAIREQTTDELHGYERTAFFDWRDDSILYLERVTIADVEEAAELFEERAKEVIEADPEPIAMRWVAERDGDPETSDPEPGSWAVCAEDAEGAVPFWREPPQGIGWGKGRRLTAQLP